MKEFTVCEVLNTADKIPMTMRIEWFEDEIKIVILRSGMLPLTGQTTMTKLCERTNKSREDAEQVIKKELSGKDKDIQFCLNESELLWRTKMWKRGTVAVQPIDNVVVLGNLSLQWLKHCGALQENSKKLQELNESLEKKSQQLVDQMKEMERVKIGMEDVLYKQFLLLLNSKKRKIRELEERFKNQSKVQTRSVYDQSTDDSDAELGESTKRRKKSKSEQESPVASTSKRLSKSPLKTFIESDEEIVLRYDESQQPIGGLNMTDEDPENDLFSQ